MTGDGMKALGEGLMIAALMHPFVRIKNWFTGLLPKKADFVAVLVEHPTAEGYYLGVSRPGNPENFNLPGGSREKGESEKDAAERELEEETDAHVTELKKVFVRLEETAAGKICAVFHSWVGYYNSPICGWRLEDPILNREGCLVKWTTKEGLCNGSFAIYNKALFAHLGL